MMNTLWGRPFQPRRSANEGIQAGGVPVRRHPLLLILVVLVAHGMSFGVLPAAGDDEGPGLKEIRELVKKVQERYDQLKDLQADFQQSTKIEGFEKTLLSSGHLYLKRPGRLRWDYREPTPEEIYVRQNEVMMYVPEHQQVLVGKLTQLAASQAPLQLLQGLARLEDHFTLEPVKGGRRGEGGLPLIALYPKGSDDESMRTVDHITLEVQPKTYVLKTVAIHEIGGNVSTFRFANIRTNGGLDNGLFEFRPPEGVEVVKAPTLAPP